MLSQSFDALNSWSMIYACTSCMLQTSQHEPALPKSTALPLKDLKALNIDIKAFMGTLRPRVLYFVATLQGC